MSKLDELLPEIRALQGLSGEPAVDDAPARKEGDSLCAVVEAELQKHYAGKYLRKDMLPEVSKVLTKAIQKKFKGVTVEVTRGRAGEIFISTSLKEN